MKQKASQNDFLKQQLQDKVENTVNLSDYYQYFKIDDLILSIKQDLYESVRKEIQNRIQKNGTDPKQLPQIQEKSDKEFLEYYYNMCQNIENQLENNAKFQYYDFNNLYFFDSKIIHERINLKKIFQENDLLRIKVLRSMYVISRRKAYVKIRERIQKSQLTYIIEKATQLFDFNEISEVQKQAVSVLTRTIQTQNFGDFQSYFDILTPLTTLPEWKQKAILSILYECTQEFLNYAFIMFDKKIIFYMLVKTDIELQQNINKLRQDNDSVYNEISDNVCEMFDQFFEKEKQRDQEKHQEEHKTKNIYKFSIHDKKGKACDYQIDLDDKELLNRGMYHIIEYVTNKEELFKIFKNLQQYSIESLTSESKFFNEDHKKRLRYYIQISFQPFSQFIISMQKQYTDYQIQNYCNNLLKEFVMNIDMKKLVVETSQGLNEIKKQIQEIGINIGENGSEFSKNFSQVLGGALKGNLDISQLQKINEQLKQQKETQQKDTQQYDSSGNI